MTDTLSPFRLEVEEALLADLRPRLDRVRWPTSAPGRPWQHGTSQAFMTALLERWRNGFDWSRWQDWLNAREQYIARVDGIDIHCIVERGSGAAPFPLILTHGWPGSIFEFVHMIDRLAHPERFGGDAGEAFTIVVPSIPGFGFGKAPGRILWPQEVADLWHGLMTGVLGFGRFGAHGGDVGATITSWLGVPKRESIAGIHLNTAVLSTPWTLAEHPAVEEELAYMQAQAARMDREDAYQHVHADKPQTLAYAIADSPIGLAAWMGEKFHGWADQSRAMLSAIALDDILATVTATWLANANPAHWLYASLRDRSGYILEKPLRVETPAGFRIYPADCAVPPPRRWLERSYTVARLSYADAGGHFPALERPEDLVHDIRSLFLPIARTP